MHPAYVPSSFRAKNATRHSSLLDGTQAIAIPASLIFSSHRNGLSCFQYKHRGVGRIHVLRNLHRRWGMRGRLAAGVSGDDSDFTHCRLLHSQ